MDIIYHYPPELTELMIQTVPRLARSKKGVLLFFTGAGVSTDMIQDLLQIVENDPDSISKYDIAREVLKRINEAGEPALRQRREILKRVTEFEAFSTCWPNDQLEAKGLVADIQKVINVKDSFTRMKQEAEESRAERANERRKRMDEERERIDKIAIIRKELFSMFSMQNHQERGKKLESVLNGLFAAYGILVKEAFTLSEPEASGIYEQVDGVIGFEGNFYLVEMKWTAEPIGRDLISAHLVRVFHRGCSRGIFISANGYTDPAVYVVKESLHMAVFVLIGLDEITFLLEQGGNFGELIKNKVSAAIVEKNPYKRQL